MNKPLLNALSVTGQMPPLELECDVAPVPGQTLTILNYPVIETYIVERLEPHDDGLGLETLNVLLRPTGQRDVATISNVVPLNASNDLQVRLERVFKIAQAAIIQKFRLEISRTDFVTLCQQSGFPHDVSKFDAIAYRGIPMSVGGDASEWNASTCFTGFSDDAHVFYVTLPGGAPFVMNPRLLEVAQLVAQGYIGIDKALTECIAAAIFAGSNDSDIPSDRMHNMLKLIRDGILPVYDGGQELTRLALPMSTTPISETFKDCPNQAASRGVKHLL